MEPREICLICGCFLTRKKGMYGKPTPEGRAYRSRHHFVAKRFLGGKTNKRRRRTPILKDEAMLRDGWMGWVNLCFDCHEELLHDPILLMPEIRKFSELVKKRNLSETKKTGSRDALAGRIKLFREVIKTGLEAVSR